MQALERVRQRTEQAIEIPFGNGLMGQLRNKLNRGRLQIVGGADHGQAARAKQVLDEANYSLSVPSALETYQYFPIRNQVATAIGALSLVDDSSLSDERYIQQIGGEDLRNLVPIAADLAQGTTQERETAIRVVYGATEQMPARALSYILPALQYAENIQRAGLKVPQVQIIFANNISARLNSLNIQKAQAESRKLAELAGDYITEFFPELAGKVIFLEDTSLEKGTVLRTEIVNVARAANEKMPDEIRKSLQQRGEEGRAALKIFYGAAHLLMHDIDLPGALKPAIPDQPEVVSPSNIISIGGFQEQFFYRLRHSIKPFACPEYRQVRTLQLFTRHRVPPYYMAEGGDIPLDSISDGLAQEGVAEAAMYDLDYLRNVSKYRGDLSEFLRREGSN